MNRVVGIVMMCSLPYLGYSDVHRYVVYLADKSATIYSISNPEVFLSERAIERRLRNSILVTADDFPVNQNYLDSLKKYGVQPFHTSRWMNAVLVEADEMDMEILSGKEFVLNYEYVAPGTKLQQNTAPISVTFDPVDPSEINASDEIQLNMIGADVMHMDEFTGKGIYIAMLDAGFQQVDKSSLFSHIFDNGRFLDAKDFVTNLNDPFLYDDHGTSALSCVASFSDGLKGTAYDAHFALYITEDIGSEYRIEEYNWLFAAERADSLGADIISSSLGYFEFDDSDMDYAYEDANGLTSIVSQAAKAASDRGILVVNSAGNEGANLDSWPYIVMPADVDEVLAVTSVDNNGNRAYFGSLGPAADGTVKPDIAAMGINVAVFSKQNNIEGMNGTSFSAPLVTGLAAGLWEKYPELSNAELKELIISSSSNSFAPDSLLGYGIPNYTHAGSSDVLSIQEVIEDVVSVFPNPFSADQISIRIESEYARQSIRFTLYSPEGKIVNSTSIRKYRKGDVLTMDINDFRKGIYVLNVKTEGISKNVKLLRY